MKRNQLIGWGLTLLAFAGVFWAGLNAQAIRDWWFLRSYEPTAEIAALASDAGFNEQGLNRFYVSDPQLLDKENFNDNCQFSEYSIVVGCYDGTNIFVLDIDDPTLEQGEIVTAAHEMLHAAYDRLSSAEKKELEPLLLEQLDKIKDEDVLETIESYRNGSPDSFINELHSVLGSEVVELIPELEEYYSQYFTDRQAIAETAQAYDEVFNELEAEADKLAAQIEKLVDELDTESARLQKEFTRLGKERKSLQKRIDNGESTSALANEIGVYESDVDQYNDDVTKYQKDIKTYNKLQAEYSALSLRHLELIRSIDSDFIPGEIVE